MRQCLWYPSERESEMDTTTINGDIFLPTPCRPTFRGTAEDGSWPIKLALGTLTLHLTREQFEAIVDSGLELRTASRAPVCDHCGQIVIVTVHNEYRHASGAYACSVATVDGKMAPG